MRTILTRLRRLEEARVPEEKERLMVDAILESRRRLGYVPEEPFPPGSFDGCHGIADVILHAGRLRRERERLERVAADND
jgi:hypothetical protein